MMQLLSVKLFDLKCIKLKLEMVASKSEYMQG